MPRVSAWGSWVLRGISAWGESPFEINSKVNFECELQTAAAGLLFRALKAVKARVISGFESTLSMGD
jgi:hypothetical protein